VSGNVMIADYGLVVTSINHIVKFVTMN
jgi:hypothetical protein